MIGSEDNAAILAEWDGCFSLPDDWTYLNQGQHRTVWLGPDGIVYKKEIPDSDSSCCNEDEFINFIKLKRRPITGWKLPNTWLYVIEHEPIVAMEYIRGLPDVECTRDKYGFSAECTCNKIPCTAWEWEKPKHMWGIIDLSAFNVIVTDSDRYLIDIVA